MNVLMEEPLACGAEALGTLLQFELTAVEVYTQAVGLFADEVVIAELQRIRDEHGRSVRALRDQLVSLGAPAADHAGGGFGPSAGAAKALGPAAALAVLRQAEENGIIEYESVLDGPGMHHDCLRVIQSEMIPACRRHVEDLNRLLGGPGR